MLVLELSPNDGPIHIINKDTGEELTILNLPTKHRAAKLGFDAPDNYTILRDKVYKRNQQGEKHGN